MTETHDFWLGRWQRGETGWHLPRVHPKLIKFWPTLQAAAQASVFVPLCGKSLDLVWLASQQHRVIACELSELAVQQFFAELGVAADVDVCGPFRRYQHKNICIYVGDYFALTPEILGGVQCIYDRAALVALPAEMRLFYIQHLQQLLPTADMLLITLYYQQSQMSGPPFAVDLAEIQHSFSAKTSILQHEDQEILEHEPRLAAKGLTSLREQVYALKW